MRAVPDPLSLIDLRRRAEAMVPRVDLPELVLEVMSWHPGFTEAFTHISGNPARVGDLGLSVAAVLCASAMNVGFSPVVSPGVEALTRDRLHHVDQHYVRLDTLAAANSVLVEAQAVIGLARLWGGGLVASVDGMRFVVPVRTIHARPNPKYFGRKRGITWMNMINDQAAGLADKVVSGTPRDSLHAVDVVLRQHGGTVPEVIMDRTELWLWRPQRPARTASESSPPAGTAGPHQVPARRFRRGTGSRRGCGGHRGSRWMRRQARGAGPW